MPLRRIIHLASFALAGGLVGWAYFLLMRQALDHYMKMEGGAGRFFGSVLVRFALFGAGFVAAYLVDDVCVIPYLAGFLVVRTVVVRRARAGVDCGRRTE
jgi:hypothetical protein